MKTSVVFLLLLLCVQPHGFAQNENEPVAGRALDSVKVPEHYTEQVQAGSVLQYLVRADVWVTKQSGVRIPTTLTLYVLDTDRSGNVRTKAVFQSEETTLNVDLVEVRKLGSVPLVGIRYLPKLDPFEMVTDRFGRLLHTVASAPVPGPVTVDMYTENKVTDSEAGEREGLPFPVHLIFATPYNVPADLVQTGTTTEDTLLVRAQFQRVGVSYNNVVHRPEAMLYDTLVRRLTVDSVVVRGGNALAYVSMVLRRFPYTGARSVSYVKLVRNLAQGVVTEVEEQSFRLLSSGKVKPLYEGYARLSFAYFKDDVTEETKNSPPR